MPKNANDMWIEEYVHALENFELALTRLKVAIDSVRVENNRLHSELITYKELWESAEAVIKVYGMREDDSN